MINYVINRQLYPGFPALPAYDADNLSLDNLEACRLATDTWLKTVTSNSMILRTQSMVTNLLISKKINLLITIISISFFV